MVVIDFFHGRNNADEKLDDWGFQGPMVGPVYIRWTYGFPRMCDADGSIWLDLKMEQGMIHLTKKDGTNEYYGDFAVVDTSDPLNVKFVEQHKDNIITLEQYMERYVTR